MCLRRSGHSDLNRGQSDGKKWIEDRIILQRTAFEILVSGLVTLVPTITIYSDVVLMKHGVSERSLTECLQEFLILMSFVLFCHRAQRSHQFRGFNLLVSGLFGAMFIREQNNLLDSCCGGAWPVFIVMLAVLIIGYVQLSHRHSVIPGMVAFVCSRSSSYILFGFVVLVFSRTFGSGQVLWRPMMQGEYCHAFKDALQEGLELFGYLYVGLGSWFYWCASRRSVRVDSADAANSIRGDVSYIKDGSQRLASSVHEADGQGLGS